MKAIVRPHYGSPDVLEFAEIEKPIPKNDEVLVKVHAAAVNPVDLFHMAGAPLLRGIPGMRTPKFKILGCDIAGRVEAAGSNARQFQPGDAVFGVTGLAGGGFAEYACSTENKLALKPKNLSFEEAAGVPIAGLTALQGLRDHGQLQAGQKVLIDGASGGVGTFAVQIAKALGAEVTAVCSTGKMDTARSLGADEVIDYTREDFTKSGLLSDLILGANAHHSVFDYGHALKHAGIYVIVGGGIPQILQGILLAPVLSRMGSKKTCFFIAKINQKDLIFLKELMEAGKVKTVIDRSYPLSETAEALRYLETKHARGKVVLTVAHGDERKSSLPA
jgi:NADPH:quinone reductase-like Zn-dependent oxidoreductase